MPYNVFKKTNVFHFTAIGFDGLGDDIPSLYINKNCFQDGDQCFEVCSAINGTNHCENITFVLGVRYKMVIQQMNVRGTYWYEVIMDYETIIRTENYIPVSFSIVDMYASDNIYSPFTSEFGYLCNVYIQRRSNFVILSNFAIPITQNITKSNSFVIFYLDLSENTGICSSSKLLSSKTARDVDDCKTKCQLFEGCWFLSFKPVDDEINLCFLFANCDEISPCPDCQTMEYADCGVSGKCEVSNL